MYGIIGGFRKSSGAQPEGEVFLRYTPFQREHSEAGVPQPTRSEDGRYTLVWSGELYNREELLERLVTGTCSIDCDDATLLLRTYIAHGVEGLVGVNGVYSLAVYDAELQELTVARDPVGVKSLYYAISESGFVFSSSLSAMSAHIEDKSISAKALAGYLTYLYSPGGLTPFQAVKKLAGGHYLRLRMVGGKLVGDTMPRAFCAFKYDGRYSTCSFETEVKVLEELLTRTVERQTRSGRSIGFFLSGGLDSSILVAIARRLYPDRELHCFTIRAEQGEDTRDGFTDDLAYARLVAKHLKVTLHEVPVDVDVTGEFDEMVYTLEEPQADPAPMNMACICKRAKEMGIDVLISGTAGDDLFSGYRRHKALVYEDVINAIPLPIRMLVKQTAGYLPSKTALLRRIKKFVEHWHLSSTERMAGYFSWLPRERMLELLSPSIREELGAYNPLDILCELLHDIPQEQSKLNQMLYWELRTFLVDHNLNYTDKVSMMTDVVVRSPFLDHELIDFAIHLDPRYKLHKGEAKYILKKVAEKYLPKEVIYRPKTGFGAPLREWIVEEMAPIIERELSVDRVKECGIFDAKSVQALVQDNRAGKIDAAYTIWSLLAIHSWIRQYCFKQSN